MARMISFALTTPQFIDGTKDVTRRNRWLKLKAGDRLMAVEKAMGLGKGGKVKRLGMIEVVSVRRECLAAITDEPDGAKREGFPDWSSGDFVSFYCKHNKIAPTDYVTRIEFRRLTDQHDEVA